MLKPKLKIVSASKEDEAEAQKIDSTDTADALHALLARKHGASCVITQNIQHFKKFNYILPSKRPSEI